MSELENDVEIVKYKEPETSKKKKIEDDSKEISQRSSQKIDVSSHNKDTLKKKNDLVFENNVNNVNADCSTIESLKNMFAIMTEIIIKQEADILEAVTGCQEPNNYKIYGKTKEGDKIPMFKCKEYSGCAMRYFCPVSCREFVMKIQSMTEEEEEEEEKESEKEDSYDNPVIIINKNFRCPVLCCIRPKMRIIFTVNEQKIGIIEQGFSFLDPIFYIYDDKDKPRYYIEADCCQCGLMCRNNFLGKTDEAHFFIYHYDDRSNPAGDICKKAAKSMFSLADDYSVILPTNATFEDKVLLMIAGIMIDYQYFEMNTDAK
jgi:hypothetical protein